MNRNVDPQELNEYDDYDPRSGHSNGASYNNNFEGNHNDTAVDFRPGSRRSPGDRPGSLQGSGRGSARGNGRDTSRYNNNHFEEEGLAAGDRPKRPSSRKSPSARGSRGTADQYETPQGFGGAHDPGDIEVEM